MSTDTTTEPTVEPTTEGVEVTPTETPQEAPTFDSTYVERLRNEAADYRVKAKRADALARQALRAMTAHDGRLIDPDDLTFDETYLDDDGLLDTSKVTAAIDALIERKPYLAARRPIKPIAQGARPEREPVNLAAILRERT